MTVGTIHSARGPRHLPAPVLAIHALPRIDYADQFTLRTDAEATPERWARAMFGDAPSFRHKLIWRALLGLRLHPDASPWHVAGWLIGARGDDWIRLDATSWFLAAHLVVQPDDGNVTLTTLLHYRRFPAPVVWGVLSTVHRRLVPVVLRGAASRIRADR